MKRLAPAHAEQALAQLATRFDHWRHHRATRRERIPDCLWEQAVALTMVLPLSRVAKCIRVSWRDLHQHCTAHPAPAVELSSTALNFVELPATPAWPVPTLTAEIELQRPDGARLRMHYHASQPPLVALVRTFLETPGCSR
jgi:hypothetical protein